jgi:hypothetical protein
MTARQVLALARTRARGAPDGFAALLLEDSTADAALEVLRARPAWIPPLVPQLIELVERELPRKRPVVLGAAMAALGALVALHRKRFLVRGYRAQWLAALSSYRAPSRTPTSRSPARRRAAWLCS